MVVEGIGNIEIKNTTLDIYERTNFTKIKNNKGLKKSKLGKLLEHTVNEKDVENVYRGCLKLIASGASITSPYNTDGVMDRNGVKILLEFKFNEKFSDKKVRCNVLAQAILYLEKFKKDGKIPNIIFVGDKKQCFFIQTRLLDKYLNESNPIHKEIQWDKPPSEVVMHNARLMNDMYNNKNLDDVLTMDVNDTTFKLKDIIPIIEYIGKHSNVKVKINEDNLIAALHFFQHNVIIDDRFNGQVDIHGEKKYIERLVDLFYNCFTNDSTVLTKNRTKLLSHGDEIKINKEQYNAFFELFEGEHYSPKEMDDLVSIKDRLIDELVRRKTGAYFTPDVWIKEARKMISDQFGKDWMDKYVVWDCASGTNNLTRGEKFKELYSSTLEQGDVDTVIDRRYGGYTFKFNFLNDDDKELPDGLIKIIKERKPLLFFINPPYGTSGSKTITKGGNKEGTATNTRMNEIMKEHKVGASSEQLYAQFLYRILQYRKVYGSDIKICVFSNPIFMSGESFNKFRDEFYKYFEFKDGMLFQANQFADVSGGWGITFTLWDCIGDIK